MPEDVNNMTGIVLCRSCSHVGKLSELLKEKRDEAVLDQLPPRMNMVKTMHGLEVTYRSPKMMAFSVLSFALFWNGVLYPVLLSDESGMDLWSGCFLSRLFWWGSFP